MNKALWTIQILLACIFLLAGGLKLFAFNMMASKTPGVEDLQWLFIFIGCCEIAGAIGLILPRLTGIMPILTPWAAAGLGTIALLAALFRIQRAEYGDVPGVLVLMLLAAFVVWGRGFRKGTRWTSEVA